MLDERKRRTFDAVVWSVSLAFAAIFPIAAAADAHRYSNANAAYQAECGTCHIAYPPALLGPDGWRGIMNGLGRHFGTDASVDEAKRAELAAYLERSAGTRKVAGAARITEAGWFRKEHSEVAAVAWKSPSVKSAANCEACHRQAAAGDFSERNIRMPDAVAR
jgi:hypothetical protein